MIDKEIKLISEYLCAHEQLLTTAESCTGGLVAKLITDLAGSSNWFERGLITYSNQAKIDLLGVQLNSIDKFGAVSTEVASEMAAGCVLHSPAQYGLSITGIAGPGGGSQEKPVGMVCFGWAKSVDGEVKLKTDVQYFEGNRQTIRENAAHHALTQLLNFLS